MVVSPEIVLNVDPALCAQWSAGAVGARRPELLQRTIRLRHGMTPSEIRGSKL
jgi:hypothetical protein